MLFEAHTSNEQIAEVTIQSDRGKFKCRKCLVIDVADDDIEIHSVNLTGDTLSKVKKIIAEL